MPIMVEEKVFDSARDAALIKAGTHFYCYGHLSARPIEEQILRPPLLPELLRMFAPRGGVSKYQGSMGAKTGKREEEKESHH